MRIIIPANPTISRLRAALILVTFLAVAPARVFANACQSAVAAGSWLTNASWVGCGGTTPGAADSVTILNGHTITINTSPTVSSITVNNGGTLAADALNRIITLNTAAAIPITLVGTGVFTPSNSTVVINGNAALTLTSGAITFNNLSLTPTITLARAYTFGAGAITVNGTFTINPTAASALALTVTMGAPITVVGTTSITRTTSATSQLSTSGSNYAFTSGLINIAVCEYGPPVTASIRSPSPSLSENRTRSPVPICLAMSSQATDGTGGMTGTTDSDRRHLV